jgi:hypothetical protein
MPYNHMFFSDTRGPLVQVALQLLAVCLDHNTPAAETANGRSPTHEKLDVGVYLSLVPRCFAPLVYTIVLKIENIVGGHLTSVPLAGWLR